MPEALCPYCEQIIVTKVTSDFYAHVKTCSRRTLWRRLWVWITRPEMR